MPKTLQQLLDKRSEASQARIQRMANNTSKKSVRNWNSLSESLQSDWVLPNLVG